jgi:hypothetical protein
VQAHPHLEFIGRDIQRGADGDDVGGDQQQPSRVFGRSTERVVLPQYPRAEEGQRDPGLHPCSGGQQPARPHVGNPVVGQQPRQALRRRYHPPWAVHHISGQRWMTVMQPGQLPHVLLSGDRKFA